MSASASAVSLSKGRPFPIMDDSLVNTSIGIKCILSFTRQKKFLAEAYSEYSDSDFIVPILESPKQLNEYILEIPFKKKIRTINFTT